MAHLKEFTATAASDTLVVFENAAHDIPQRVLHRPAAATGGS
jgi:hypothetical protein